MANSGEGSVHTSQVSAFLGDGLVLYCPEGLTLRRRRHSTDGSGPPSWLPQKEKAFPWKAASLKAPVKDLGVSTPLPGMNHCGQVTEAQGPAGKKPAGFLLWPGRLKPHENHKAREIPE